MFHRRQVWNSRPRSSGMIRKIWELTKSPNLMSQTVINDDASMMTRIEYCIQAYELLAGRCHTQLVINFYAPEWVRVLVTRRSPEIKIWLLLYLVLFELNFAKVNIYLQLAFVRPSTHRIRRNNSMGTSLCCSPYNNLDIILNALGNSINNMGSIRLSVSEIVAVHLWHFLNSSSPGNDFKIQCRKITVNSQKSLYKIASIAIWNRLWLRLKQSGSWMRTSWVAQKVTWW